jgi:hypothetical protein
VPPPIGGGQLDAHPKARLGQNARLDGTGLLTTRNIRGVEAAGGPFMTKTGLHRGHSRCRPRSPKISQFDLSRPAPWEHGRLMLERSSAALATIVQGVLLAPLGETEQRRRLRE